MTKGIDHLVLCVSDLGATRAKYMQMGFTMSPKAVHPFGTANSLVQFSDRSFLEPLSIVDPSLISPPQKGAFSFAEFNRQFIEDGPGEGFSMLVLDSSDSKRDHELYTNAGLNPYDHFGFKRQTTLPSGEQVEVQFSMAFVTFAKMPDAAFFTCQQHHAPELFWKNEYQTHENTALGIAEVLLLTEEPAAHVQFFADLAMSDDVTESGNSASVQTSRGKITLMNLTEWSKHFPAGYAPDLLQGPRLAGYRLNVGDVDASKECLSAANIQKIETGRDIIVAPDEAFGVMIGFTQV